MKFLVLSQTQATNVANDSTKTYTPGYDPIANKYYLYTTDTDDVKSSTVSLAVTQADGLTPVNPTKPIYPRNLSSN